jgi:hypothetical protein
MEIDAGQIRDKDSKKEAENARLCKEGRCYKCGQQGHLKHNCPDWPKRPDKPPPYPFKARSTNTLPLVQETKEEQDPNLKELAQSMSLMDDAKKDELFDLLLEGKEDF